MLSVAEIANRGRVMARSEDRTTAVLTCVREISEQVIYGRVSVHRLNCMC